MKVKILDKQLIVLILMLLPVFEPKIFTQYQPTTILYIGLNLIELFIFATLILGSDYARNVRWPVLFWVAFRLYLFLVMVCRQNMSGILQWGYLSLMVVNLFLIFEYAEKKNIFPTLLKAISILGIILLAINFYTLIKYNRGIIPSAISYFEDGDYYFLGIKTQFTTMMFPTIAAAGSLYYLDYQKKNKALFLFAIVICILNIFNKHISTPTVGIVIIIIMMFLSNIGKIKWDVIKLFISAIILQIAIVWFDIQVLFSVFIERILHKDATLSARMYIWRSAKMLIKYESLDRLIFGNGIYKLNCFVPYSGGYWQPHNQLITWLHSGGILGTCIIIIFLVKLCKGENKMSKVYQWLSIICFLVLFLSVTEVYFDVASCYVPFVSIYYFNRHCKKKGGYQNCVR